MPVLDADPPCMLVWHSQTCCSLDRQCRRSIRVGMLNDANMDDQSASNVNE